MRLTLLNLIGLAAHRSSSANHQTIRCDGAIQNGPEHLPHLPNGLGVGVLDGHENHASYLHHCSGCVQRTIHGAAVALGP